VGFVWFIWTHWQNRINRQPSAASNQ